EVAEERERTDRIVLRVHRIEARRMDEAPERVRLSVRKGMAPPVGAFVERKARLNPPLSPLRPGGYDFSRDLFFQRLGASGFAIGPIKTAEPPAPPGYRLRYATFMEDLRNISDRRIRAAATFYLLLSGAQVATQRSYYMIAVVPVGVLFDRAAITFRTLAVAAIAVLLLAPEAVVHPSFQISFAATLALVAGYQHGSPF